MKKSVSLCFAVLLAVAGAARAATTAVEYYQEGLGLYQGGQYDQAITDLKKAVQLDPDQWQSYSVMGHCLVKLGQTPEALDAYSKSLALHPDATLQAYYDNLKAQQPAPAATSPAPAPATTSTLPDMNSPAAAPMATAEATPIVMVNGSLVTKKFEMSYNSRRQWSKIYGGLLYATLGSDLNNYASSGFSNMVSGFGYTGAGKNDNIGFYISGEYGYLLDPFNGFSVSVDYLQAGGFSGTANDGSGDTFSQTFKPSVLDGQLNYYRFFPMGKSRLYITGGGGYYYGLLAYSDQTTFSGLGSDTNPSNMTGYGWGGTVGIGWETLITPQGSLGLYARGRYASLSHFQGTYTGENGDLAVDDSTGQLYVETNTSKVGTGSIRWANIDMTGFDIGASFAYHF